MFGNLIESSSHKGDYARRSSFFLGTLTVYALIFMAIGVGSIYAYNTHVEHQNLELVSLITPVESPQLQAAPRSTAPRPAAAGNNSDSKTAVVKTRPVITTMDPQRIPDKASVASDVTELPTGMNFRIGIPGPNDNIFGGTGDKTPGGGSLGNNPGGGSKELEELSKTAPPLPIRKETVKPPTKTVSLGVVNGKASNLPKPVYTAIAKAGRASGLVTVQVLIDESGKVVSARALSGHPLLLKESVQAAYQARFTPTTLSNQPVKVSGIITYNFVMQ
jgi:TonB family protein